MVGSGTIHRPPYLLALTGLDEPFEGRHFDRGIMVL
jgi:hypothetical protein